MRELLKQSQQGIRRFFVAGTVDVVDAVVSSLCCLAYPSDCLFKRHLLMENQILIEDNAAAGPWTE